MPGIMECLCQTAPTIYFAGSMPRLQAPIPAALAVGDRFITGPPIISEQFEQLIVSIELRPRRGDVIVSPVVADRVASLVTDLANEIRAIRADARPNTVMVL